MHSEDSNLISEVANSLPKGPAEDKHPRLGSFVLSFVSVICFHAFFGMETLELFEIIFACRDENGFAVFVDANNMILPSFP